MYHYLQNLFFPDPVTVTFKGYSYVTYRVYDWRDRVHSEAARISFSFRVSISFFKTVNT